jgi:hypothetical protein
MSSCFPHTHDGLALGLRHGYAFCGPEVRLNAFIQLHDPCKAGCKTWSLQLWAQKQGSDCVPASVDPSAILVAQLPFSIPFELCGDECGEGFFVEVQGTASSPAGAFPWKMTMVLANEDGAQDHAIYPEPAFFSEPRIEGEISLICHEPCCLNVEQVFNPRPPENLSGTLVLELWILDTPYGGGSFSGYCAARRMLGSLPGQGRATQLQVEALPPALFCSETQTGFPVLMLREWHVDDYLTRDFRCLQGLFCTLPASTASFSPLTFSPQSPLLHPEESCASAVGEATFCPSDPPASPSKPILPPALACLNRLSEKELKACGLPKPILDALCSQRPWPSFEAVKKIKGLGEQRFRKLMAFLDGQ